MTPVWSVFSSMVGNALLHHERAFLTTAEKRHSFPMRVQVPRTPHGLGTVDKGVSPRILFGKDNADHVPLDGVLMVGPQAVSKIYGPLEFIGGGFSLVCHLHLPPKIYCYQISGGFTKDLKYSSWLNKDMGFRPFKKEILVICPACHKTGTVTVDRHFVEGALELEGDSMLQVHLFAEEICDHTFTVTVDAHFMVRQAELPPT